MWVLYSYIYSALIQIVSTHKALIYAACQNDPVTTVTLAAADQVRYILCVQVPIFDKGIVFFVY